MRGINMYITRHFRTHEFACPCCGRSWISHKLVRRLQQLRHAVNVPIAINSGCRCLLYNDDVNGAPNSYHLNGMAADISFAIPGGVESLYDKTYGLNDSFSDLVQLIFDGVIFYDNFIHVDVRGYKWSEARNGLK